MTIKILVHVEIRPTEQEVRLLGHARYDTAPLADLVEKVLHSEFGPRLGAVWTSPPEHVAEPTGP